MCDESRRLFPIDIDTGNRSAIEVVDAMEAVARQKLPDAGFRDD